MLSMRVRTTICIFSIFEIGTKNPLWAIGNFKDDFHKNFEMGNKEILNEAKAIKSAGYKSIV